MYSPSSLTPLPAVTERGVSVGFSTLHTDSKYVISEVEEDQKKKIRLERFAIILNIFSFTPWKGKCNKS